MALLYTKRDPTLSYPAAGGSTSKRLAQELAPTGNGHLDIIDNFPWTLTPSNSKAIRETPYIVLTEYYMIQSALNQQLAPYGVDTSAAASDGLAGLMGIANQPLDAETKKLYEGVFDISSSNFTGFVYRLPLYTPEYYSANNSWEKKDILDTVINFQKAGLGFFQGAVGGALGMFQRQKQQGTTPSPGSKRGAAMEAVGKGSQSALNTMQAIPDILRQVTLLKLQKQNPAVGLLDPPHLWQGSSPREYSFSFFLYNIEPINSTERDVQNLILKNWEFCYILTYQNSMNKRNFFTAAPPVFYQVAIPGTHYCKASIMKSINISNVGNVRSINLPIDGGTATPVNVPDAYKIDITMQDVFMPSKNLLEAVIDPEYRQQVQGG